ncbi:MAG: toll/interleukin-1 receptor domain-containing protein [Erysipelotrichaceae bacterium]|nr:toll/interleukin-1 receptor domain-containing protein [Erysipelotrichaceae bacterium]
MNHAKHKYMKSFKQIIDEILQTSIKTKNNVMYKVISNSFISRGSIIYENNLENLSITYREIQLIFSLISWLLEDEGYRVKYYDTMKLQIVIIMEDNMKDVVYKIPYGKRDEYMDFVYKVNKVVSSSGMVAIGVNNIPYNLAIVLCIRDNEKNIEIIDDIAREYNVIKETTENWNTVFEKSIKDKKWDLITLRINEDLDSIKFTINNMCAFIPMSEMEKNGYKNVVDYNSIFISYSHKDKEIVYEFEERCRRLSLPIWIDRVDIDYGDSINDEINKGLRKSKLFLVFVSKNTLTSKYARHEIDILYQKLIKSNDERVIIIKLDDVDLDEIYSGLNTRKYLDYTNKAEVERFIDSLETLLKKYR